MPSDHLRPALVTADDAALKVRRSTVFLSDLLAGRVARKTIELAFSRHGCGAVLVRLDERGSDAYETFYRLQWQLGTRAFGNDHAVEGAAGRFDAFDSPVRRLLCECALAVARARIGVTRPTSVSLVELTKLLRTGARSLSVAVGRPLAANRKEFHPSVHWLIEQEKTGGLRKDEDPAIDVVAVVNDRGRPSQIFGRVRADEAQLLALYREWAAASPEERCGHGGKHNGNVYYGAYRGHTHLDSGSTMTVLYGPGELRDRAGSAPDVAVNSADLGGTLIVAAPGEDRFTPLPYRLPCGSPFVVVFFEQVRETPMSSLGPTPPGEMPDNGGFNRGQVCSMDRGPTGINTNAMGWAATVHGVRRIENPAVSRGQTVMHMLLTHSDLN